MELKHGKDFVGTGVGVMIRNPKGEVLLLRRTEKCRNEAGKYTFPGGRIEFGEKGFDAAKREALEETGCEIEPIRLLKLVDHIIPEEKQHWLNPIIEARILKGNPKITEPEKCSEMKWFSIKSLPELTINLKDLFKDINEGKIKL